MGIFRFFRKGEENITAPEEIQKTKEQEREELSEGLQKTKEGIFSKLARAVAGNRLLMKRCWTRWKRC